MMKDRTSFLSKSAYLRKRERSTKDSLLTEEEEKQLQMFDKSCEDRSHEKLCERYLLPSGLSSEIVTAFRRMGHSYQHQLSLNSQLSVKFLKENKNFAWCTAIDCVKEFHLLDGWSATEWASHIINFGDENEKSAFKDIFIALYYLVSSNDVRKCAKAMARLKYLLITLQGIEFDKEHEKTNNLESLLSIATKKESPPKIILVNEPIIIKPYEMDWKEIDIKIEINRYLTKFTESEPDICHNLESMLNKSGKLNMKVGTPEKDVIIKSLKKLGQLSWIKLHTNGRAMEI